jgi:hypothetical protein
MPNRQRHRGRHPEDEKAFAPACIGVLREAVAELSYLLTAGYAEKSSLKFVGDHYQLTARQRRAVNGASCSNQSLNRRASRAVATSNLQGCALVIDGYNLLISTEAMLSGGMLFRGRDGCIRDLASVHGSYHTVEETCPALRHIGQALERSGVDEVTWYLDAPVSNSGRLRALLCEESERHDWNWVVELTNHTDETIACSHAVVATSDGWILDRAESWANLSEVVAGTIRPEPVILNLGSR